MKSIGIRIALAVALGVGALGGKAIAQAPSLVWAQTYSASTSSALLDRSIGVALNETHAYDGGTAQAQMIVRRCR